MKIFIKKITSDVTITWQWKCSNTFQPTSLTNYPPHNINIDQQYWIGKEHTSLTGRVGSSTERVKHSFHSGLVHFFITRVFSFCRKKTIVQKKRENKITSTSASNSKKSELIKQLCFCNCEQKYKNCYSLDKITKQVQINLYEVWYLTKFYIANECLVK